ncbi:JAB domain-containing protein [Albibacterium bauzanense]|uniref:DNA repair protein RadC n=1 Tax=Albibacterium bauzanense TaxID=653929 RepID=A0A4R1LRM7_9SPHI|nr:JAB domain-containing protein [Albibacterium bauzanense]TCK80890.1 DNA repair protein RadC [Albibacterium bauzanense]
MATQQDQISLYQVSEINLTYRPKFKASERPKVTSSKDAYEILYNNWDLDKIELLELFKILLLNRANNVIGIFQVSSGGIAGTVADPKLIFSTALKACASSIILSHNHPSGNLQPSQQDIELTKKIKTGGSYLDIMVLDHVIITSDRYYSFADEGMI